ncbi:unnamed protein product [Dibothriocephalus latus]|uniref:Uncharacterized protein n=1 Tax=Dibothriocephalus latus TaxID=60516 RepID=A0A3P7NYD5_DIBLA|nr:unnamed protein product [Dibothriocephalus latus]
MKDKYYHDTNTAGPQSRLLDGLTWDEARRIRDDALGKALGPGAVSASISATSHPTVAAASISFSTAVEDIPLCSSSVIVGESESHEPGKPGPSDVSITTEPRLSPPATAGGITSEASEVEESAVSDKKVKKKRRFKLLSFPRKSKAKEKKGGS